MSCIWCNGRDLPDHDCSNFSHFCSWCREHPCVCDVGLEAVCDLENPESCESCQ